MDTNELYIKDKIKKNYSKLISMEFNQNYDNYLIIYREIKKLLNELLKEQTIENIEKYFHNIQFMQNFKISDFTCDHFNIKPLGQNSTIKYSKCLSCGKTWFY